MTTAVMWRPAAVACSCGLNVHQSVVYEAASPFPTTSVEALSPLVRHYPHENAGTEEHPRTEVRELHQLESTSGYFYLTL